MSDVHAGREAGRAWWWAVLRTERDRRLALAAGRPITARNLRRLLMRRLAKLERRSCRPIVWAKHVFDGE